MMSMEIQRSNTFDDWVASLDVNVAARIETHIVRIGLGLGDYKSLRDGIGEYRIHTGPGYRLYVKRQGNTLVILLCGGAKESQRRDINKAIKIAQQLGE